MVRRTITEDMRARRHLLTCFDRLVVWTAYRHVIKNIRRRDAAGFSSYRPHELVGLTRLQRTLIFYRLVQEGFQIKLGSAEAPWWPGLVTWKRRG